jgi:hypothetical protein
MALPGAVTTLDTHVTVGGVAEKLVLGEYANTRMIRLCAHTHRQPLRHLLLPLRFLYGPVLPPSG